MDEDVDHEHRHEHGGRSSKSLINAKKLLQNIGVNAGDVLLDLGCGDGYISIEASVGFVGKSGKVHATDVDAASIQKVQRQIDDLGLQNIDAIIADATKAIPFEDRSVDTCIIANVLHGFVVNREIDGVLSELFRVMKPGGKIAIIEFKKSKRIPGPPYEDRLAPVDITNLMEKRGCTLVNSFSPGMLHYGLTFKVP